VSGDFEAWVHVTNMSTINAEMTGLMARIYNNTNAGAATGGPGGATSGTPPAPILRSETHVSWFKAQAGALTARSTTDGGGSVKVAGVNTTDTYLLLQRYRLTNFYFYEKASATGNWIPVPNANKVLVEFTNPVCQVGIAEQMLSASIGRSVLDGFNL